MNIESLQEARDAAVKRMHELNTKAEEIEKRIADAEDGVDVSPLREELETTMGEFDEAADEVERTKRNLADGERRAKAIAENPAVEKAHAAARGSLKHESIYAKHITERQFVQDAFAFLQQHDSRARERLEQHGREMLDLGVLDGTLVKRDVGTGAFAGLTVPQYLLDEYAPLARAGSPLLNAIPIKRQLPASGLQLNIGRVTTGTAVAAQASENSGVQETDFDDTLLQVNVRTYSGQQDVSRQALERSEMVDVEVFGDLIADYYTKLDAAIINSDGTSGTHLGIRSVSGINAITYTDASPTVPELYPKIADGIRQINKTVYSVAKATTIVMHSTRWGWGTAALDSSSRPLFLPNANGPFNAMAVGEAAGYGQVMGVIAGLPVITDDNILTNLGGGTEDVILIVAGGNLRFWQDGDGAPRQFRFEQANAPQSIRLAVWGYSAFTAGKYPGASSVIGGTGLAAQTL